LRAALAATLLGGTAATHAANIYPANIQPPASFNWSFGPDNLFGTADDMNLQWGQIDILAGGAVGISGVQPRNGNGSLEVSGTSAASKAGVAYYPGPNSTPLPPPGPGFGQLKDLTAASYEWYAPAGQTRAALIYPKKWVDAQLSHADPDKTSATYNHAEYVEQRRVMMQDWADRLDLFEQNQVEAASTALTITLQGLPTITGQGQPQPQLPVFNPNAPVLPATVQRLPAVNRQLQPSEIQRERLALLEMFEAPHNLPVADYAKLTGRSLRAVSYEIQAGKLLSLHLGTRGQRVPDWQIDPLKRKLVQAVLKQVPMGMDSWHIYRALLQSYDELGKRPAIHVVRPTNLHLAARLVAERCVEADTLEAIARMPRHRSLDVEPVDEDECMAMH